MFYHIVFSPCGGTKKVMQIISSVWKEEKKEIDVSDPMMPAYTLHEDDVCILAVPSYGGRVPGIVIERLKRIEANHAKAILVCVFGNRAYEDTLLELKEAAMQQGFACIAAISAVAQHSIMPVYGTNRPDEEDTAELLEFAQRIKQKLEQNKLSEVFVCGNHPYKEYHGIPLKPSADKNCIQCGLCAEKCPVMAIDKQHPNKTNTDVCISCMRCISICPTHARKLNKVLLMASVTKLKKACTSRKENELFVGE